MTRMRRFWTEAHAAPMADGHHILLDGKPLRLPSGAVLCVGPAALAGAIAAEWREVGDELSWSDLPLTQLAGTAQERIAPDPAATIAALAVYGGSDLLCYRARHPASLVRAQAESWQPWLDWAAATHGARLHPTSGVMPIAQDAAALAALGQALSAHGPEALAALGIAVPALGSLVLGLALAAGLLDAARSFDLATLDEQHQEQIWGQDAPAQERLGRLRAELVTAERFLRLASA